MRKIVIPAIRQSSSARAPIRQGLSRSLFLRIVLLGALAAPALAQPQSFIDIVRGSGFIFQGTVKAIGSSTPSVVREPNTAVVVVDRVIEALPPVGNPKGKEVTVRLRDPSKVRPGQATTFFTYVYSAGATLGLEEVALLPLEDPKALEGRIHEARRALADEALAKRLASARLVVVGVVGAADPTEAAREPVSEHDPLWRRTPIRVESFEKGGPTSEPVFVNVSYSTDIMWQEAPKPRAGDAGIFLLQPDPGPDKWSRVSGLFLVDPLDALSRSDLDRVRRLLRSR
jgi:hypothetical protein